MNNHFPEPDSLELKERVKGSKEKAIYSVLYAHQDTPLSISEIRKSIGFESGEQEHLNRRLRNLYANFEIEKTKKGTEWFYRLIGVKEKALNTETINKADRAWALRDKRCVQCGRTPEEDSVKLHVDHKIPQAWGGKNDRDNLQALCSECNEGKKNLYATYDKFADKIKLAANYDEPHKRIGELLKAFNGAPVSSDLLEIVANSKQYQDDWQKRLRELRVLGWKYSFDKKKEGKRFKTYFKLEHYEPWPRGKIRSSIREREIARKQAKESE